MRPTLPLLFALALVACNKKSEAEASTTEKKEEKAEKQEEKAEKKEEKAEKKEEKKDDKADKNEKCALAGKWSGTTPAGNTPVNGKPITVEFADGTSEWNAGPMKNTGKWTLEGNAFTVDNVSKGGGPYACKNGDPGKYKVTFDGCKKITFKIDADACQGRSRIMDGLVLEKSG